MLQKAVGIVSEFNPFHLGHQYLIDKTREYFGDDTLIVSVMSGDFVQRGDVACFSKFARAKAACQCGADLVLELPLPWCLASAEPFADRAVDILCCLGGISAISCGSECGDSTTILQVAKYLLTDQMEENLKQELEINRNYAAARQAALARISPELSRVLEKPNNILAVEYAKAMLRRNWDVELFTVTRSGGAHDGYSNGDVRSAKEIRGMMENDGSEQAWMQFLPEGSRDILKREIHEGRGPVFERQLEKAILSRLRQFSREELESLPDMDKGLSESLYRGIRSSGSLEELMMSMKHKSITLSRIRRMVYAAALGIRGEMIQQEPDYIRILSFNERGKAFLHEAKPSVPLITKPAHLNRLEGNGKDQFELGSSAHDLYVLAYDDSAQWVCGEDWKQGPSILV